MADHQQSDKAWIVPGHDGGGSAPAPQAPSVPPPPPPPPSGPAPLPPPPPPPPATTPPADLHSWGPPPGDLPTWSPLGPPPAMPARPASEVRSARRRPTALVVAGIVVVVLTLLGAGVLVVAAGSDDDDSGVAASSASSTTSSTESDLRKRRDEREEQERIEEQRIAEEEKFLDVPLDDLVAQPIDAGFEVVAAWVDEPRFVGGLLIAPEERGVVAINTVSGAVAWVNEECVYGGWQTVVPGPEAPVVVLQCDGLMTGIRVADGTTAWQNEMDGYPDRGRLGPTMFVAFYETDQVMVVTDLETGAEINRLPQTRDANVVSNSTTVFLSDDSGVRAIDPVSGGENWSLVHPSSGLMVDGDVVYARTNDHVVEALDAATGDMIWRSEAEASRLDWSDFVGQTDTSVIIEATEDPRYLTAYDKATGARSWIIDPPAAQYGGGGTALATSVDGSSGVLTVLDGSTGAVLTSFEGVASYYQASSAGRVVAFVTEEYPQRLRVVVVP